MWSLEGPGDRSGQGVYSRSHGPEKVALRVPSLSSRLAWGSGEKETQGVLSLLPVPRLSKAIASSIMALICAINLYFVVTYLPSLPHPAYFVLVALLAAVYLGLTTYLVL